MTAQAGGLFEIGEAGHLSNGHHESSAAATMTVLCRSLADILSRITPATPSRIRLTCADSSVDIEWRAGEPTHGTPAGDPVATATVTGPPPARTGHHIRAPLVGTFFRCPEPGAKPFVEVGDVVEVGQQVGIVEAMKLMNPIESDQQGRVVEVLAGDGEPVEYDQPLIILAPLGNNELPENHRPLDHTLPRENR